MKGRGTAPSEAEWPGTARALLGCVVPVSPLGYRRVWVRPDAIAGLTGPAGVPVPEALAYATIAGVPPVIGLYAAVPVAGPVCPGG